MLEKVDVALLGETGVLDGQGQVAHGVGVFEVEERQVVECQLVLWILGKGAVQVGEAGSMGAVGLLGLHTSHSSYSEYSNYSYYQPLAHHFIEERIFLNLTSISS